MLTLGPSLVPWVMGSPWVRLVVVLLLRPVVQGYSGWKNCCCCCYDVLREWFKFRPTTAGQTVVLRTGTWHKVATIHTHDSLASALVCCLMLLLLMGWCNVSDSSQRIQHTRTDLEMLSCRSIGCDPALLPGTPPRVCPFRNVLLSERKHRSQFCGLPFFYMRNCLSSTYFAFFFLFRK